MSPLRRLIDEFLDPDAPEAATTESQHLFAGISRLVDVTSVLAAEMDASKLPQIITREACNALRCERSILFFYNPRAKELIGSVLTARGIEEFCFTDGEGIVGQSAQQRKLIHVPDPSEFPQWESVIDKATNFETRHSMAAPLLTPRDDSLLAVLQVDNRKGQGFDEVDEELLTAYCLHAAVALDRISLLGELRRRQQSQTSLDVARQIQRGYMPDRLPDIPGYETATWWLPNESVGADYCDLIPLKNGRVALAVADVSGHGIGPSMIMASLRAALQAMVLEHSQPEVLLNLLGRSLAKDLVDGRFITMVIAVLDPRNGSLEYANAGHGPAVHFDAATGDFYSLESTGMPLGLEERPEYPQGWPIDMQKGDMLILGTDGIIEAMDSKDRTFGQEALEQLIYDHSREPVSKIVQAISRYWIIPESADHSLSAQFEIRLAPNGSVLSVNLKRSSGDSVLDRSAETAIYKASPLPVPGDDEVFSQFQVLNLTVRPEEIMRTV